MPRISPTLEGFRAAFRRPSFTFAEIAWRWMVGATATALFFYGLFEYLNTLPVTNGELLFLRTRHPFFIWRALTHILRGSFSRGVIALILAAMLISLFWMIAASFGRVATVRAMQEYFRERHRYTEAAADTAQPEAPSTADVMASLLRLNFLRVAAVLAGALGLVGAAILSGFASSDAHPRPGLVFFLFVPVAALVILAVWGLNWFLSLSAVFAVHDGDDTLAAISSAVELCRERTGAVFAVSTWTGLGHLAAFVIATTVVFIPLGLVPFVPWRLAVAVVLLMTLVYFALADWLYTARLAGYVCITELPEAAFAPPPPPPVIQLPPPQTTIDRDELILSDVPSPVIS